MARHKHISGGSCRACMHVVNCGWDFLIGRFVIFGVGWLKPALKPAHHARATTLVEHPSSEVVCGCSCCRSWRLSFRSAHFRRRYAVHENSPSSYDVTSLSIGVLFALVNAPICAVTRREICRFRPHPTFYWFCLTKS